MKFALLLLMLVPLKALSCVEVMENRRVNDITYKFYADDGKDKCLRLPYVQKNFNPQSLFLGENKIGFISLNHNKQNYEDEKFPARVVQADLRTGKTLRTYSLMGSQKRGKLGKVNSVTLFDSETKFVVPSGKSLCLFDRKNARQTLSGVYQAKLLSCQKQYTGGKGEFASSRLSLNHNKEKYLWTVFKSEKGSKIYGFKTWKGKILSKSSYSFDLPSSVSDVEYFSVVPSKDRYSFLLAPSKGELAYQINYDKNEKAGYKLASIDKFGNNRLPASKTKASKPLPSAFKTYDFLNLKDVYSNSRAKIYNLTSLED